MDTVLFEARLFSEFVRDHPTKISYVLHLGVIMVKLQWGIMELDSLISLRRVRTLGLGASVRHFNDRAVPGLGGLWFAKQLLWALLGIDMAERLRRDGKRVQNIETANAIEALACLIAITDADGSEDSTTNRIKGENKLEGQPYPTFTEARKRFYYISQPMRMGTVQPLVKLGLVTAFGSRFNSFSMSDFGHEFLELACTERFSGMRNRIFNWVSGKTPTIDRQTTLMDFLHPNTPLALPACHLLMQALQADEDRNNALNWLASMKKTSQPLRWSCQPTELSAEHWHTLYAGSRLFRVRNSAIHVMNVVEKQLAMTKYRELPLTKISVGESLQALRTATQNFLDTNYSDAIARELCLHCTAKQELDILRHLLTLDGQAVRLIGDVVVPGPAFRGDLTVIQYNHIFNDDTENDHDAETSEQLPTDWKAMHPLVMLSDISKRLYNLEELQADLLHQPHTLQEGTA